MRAVPKDWASNAKGGNHHEGMGIKRKEATGMKKFFGAGAAILPFSALPMVGLVFFYGFENVI